MFIETYGCQMNVSDTETVVAIMQREGYVYTDRIGEADVILINTCSIRDNAEQRIWGRLAEMKRYRRERPGLVVGIIGCMAERLREKLKGLLEERNLVHRHLLSAFPRLSQTEYRAAFERIQEHRKNLSEKVKNKANEIRENK